jgi:hypothetical protein
MNPGGSGRVSDSILLSGVPIRGWTTGSRTLTQEGAVAEFAADGIDRAPRPVASGLVEAEEDAQEQAGVAGVPALLRAKSAPP